MALLYAFFWAILPWHQAYAKREERLSALSVLADPSIAVPLAQIIKSYSALEFSTVTVSFGTAKEHAASIGESSEANILITVRPQWIDELKTQGRVDATSQIPLARNKLVLVGPADSTLQLDINPQLELGNLLRAQEAEPVFVIADPENLNEGGFAVEALSNLGLLKEAEPYFYLVKEPLALLQTVSQRHGYGVTYFSETVDAPGVKVLGTFPETSHVPIIYYAVAITGDNTAEAKKFLEFLKSDKAKEIFERNGFDTLFTLSLPQPEASGPEAQTEANP